MLHILMVDEEPEILELASIYLPKYGSYSIDKAYSVKEALSFLNNNSYDAIISDYEMPETNGLEFLKIIRQVDQSVPFIIFSGKGREEVVTEAFRSGADGYVQKSSNPWSQYAELDHQIDIASKKRYAEQELRMKEYAIEMSFNGIMMFDEEKKIIYANKAAVKLHGYDSKDSVIGRDIEELFFFGEEEGDTGFFSSLQNNRWYFGELEGRKGDGKRINIELSAVKISNEIKKEIYYFISYVDITEKKKAEDALLQYLTEAARRLKEPLNHICRNILETIDEIDKIDEVNQPEKTKLKLSVQVKNTQQIIENLKELNKTISNGFDSIPEDFKDFISR